MLPCNTGKDLGQLSLYVASIWWGVIYDPIRYEDTGLNPTTRLMIGGARSYQGKASHRVSLPFSSEDDLFIIYEQC
jgi:hypothetical protein